MVIRWLECTAGVVAVLLVAGCAGVTPAPEDRAGPSTTASSRFGAPEVTTPVDVSGLVVAPCDTLLTASELAAMDIRTDGRPRSYLGATACSWTSDLDDRLSISVDAQRDLLVDSYRTRTPIFEPTTVAGFPAVRQRTSRNANTCTVTAGVGPQQALEADWTGHRPPSADEDPCARAEEAIALVIRKLPPQR